MRVWEWREWRGKRDNSRRLDRKGRNWLGIEKIRSYRSSSAGFAAGLSLSKWKGQALESFERSRVMWLDLHSYCSVIYSTVFSVFWQQRWCLPHLCRYYSSWHRLGSNWKNGSREPLIEVCFRAPKWWLFCFWGTSKMSYIQCKSVLSGFITMSWNLPFGEPFHCSYLCSLCWLWELLPVFISPLRLERKLWSFFFWHHKNDIYVYQSWAWFFYGFYSR